MDDNPPIGSPEPPPRLVSKDGVRSYVRSHGLRMTLAAQAELAKKVQEILDRGIARAKSNRKRILRGYDL